MDMNSNDISYIEGIGNEVVIFLTGLFAVSLITFLIYKSFTNSAYNSVNNYQHINEARRLNLVNNNNTSGDPGNSNMTNRPRHFSPDQICPVCLARPNYPVETNCGHLFCAQCVITYWRHGNWIGAIKCPVCRAVVTAIMPCFRPEQVQSSPEGTRIVNEVNDYNRRYSGEPRPWLDYLWDLPTLLRHAGSEFFSFGGIMYMFRLRILLCFVAAIMYLISPLDMIPEAVFGILGLLDDMFVLLLVAIYVTVIYRRFLATRWENQQTQN